MLRVGLKITAVIAGLGIMLALSSCEEVDRSRDRQPVSPKVQKENVEEANRNLVKLEREMIDEYVRKSGLDFVETGTGLRYFIENKGDGELIKQGDIVTMEYEMRLMDGELLYSSDKDGLKVFLVGRGGVESGLEEAVLHLHKNDKAIVIIPSHLAHGLAGDGKRIPARSTLVYELKIIDNHNKK